MQALLPNAVVIEFMRSTAAFFTGAGCVGGPDRQAFPLSLGEARLVSLNGSDGAWGAHIPRLWLPLRRVNGDRYLSLNVWFGPKVSREDRLIAERIVASISPPEASCTYRLV
jgi:hypothetical protein